MSKVRHNKKNGPMSREEETYIISLLDSQSDEAIADLTGRNPLTIAKFRASVKSVLTEHASHAVVIDLKRRFFWEETVQQLLPNEIEYFQNYWASLINQFQSTGIVSTDELMIRDLIILDIHLNRCNKSRRAVAAELQEIEDDIIKAMSDFKDDPVGRLAALAPLQDRANALRTASKSLNIESKDIQEKKDKKYEQLKATREMRLEKVEKAGQDFYQLVKHLDSPEMREQQGRINYLYQIAVEIAKREFQQLHKYGNDTYDNPILTPEMELENENSNNNGN